MYGRNNVIKIYQRRLYPYCNESYTTLANSASTSTSSGDRHRQRHGDLKLPRTQINWTRSAELKPSSHHGSGSHNLLYALVTGLTITRYVHISWYHTDVELYTRLWYTNGNRIFAETFWWVGFLAVCSLHKINPNPRKKYLLWEKVAQMPKCHY